MMMMMMINIYHHLPHPATILFRSCLFSLFLFHLKPIPFSFKEKKNKKKLAFSFHEFYKYMIVFFFFFSILNTTVGLRFQHTVVGYMYIL